MAIEKVGVVGCGLMGSGIAQVCASAGYATTVMEVNDELLNRGMGRINKSLARAVEKGKIKEDDQKAIMDRLHGTTSLADLGASEVVIEAATEHVETKKKIFSELDSRMPKHGIIASNTSSLTIIELAAATGRPDRVVGLHFFNPVPIMKLVEVVRTIVTSDDAYDTARSFATSLGKEVVEAKDTTGFVVNRLLVRTCWTRFVATSRDWRARRTWIAA